MKQLNYQEYKKDNEELWVWVREEIPMPLNGMRFTVMIGQVDLYGSANLNEHSNYVVGEEAFRKALELSGKDPQMAQSEYEKAISGAREMPQLPSDFRPGDR